MTPCPSTSSTSGTVDALIYSHVKRENPRVLLEIFPREKCKDLERNDHCIDPDLLKIMWQHYRIQKKPTSTQKEAKEEAESASPEANQEETESWKTDWMHKRFCRLQNPSRSVNLALYHHFHSKLNFKAVDELFDEETRKEFEKLMEKVDVPKIERMLAFYCVEMLKPKNRRKCRICKCRLCKKEIKGTGKQFLRHIGLHEDIPSYCFMEGCNKYYKSFETLHGHIHRMHDLLTSELDSTQYHRLQTAKMEYSRKAANFLDRYFPPESFVRFNDRKMQNLRMLEDSKCQKCGELARTIEIRRSHIVNHLGLSFKCVIEGCGYKSTTPSNLSSHINHFHRRKINDLSEKELYAHKKAKVEFNRVMKQEVPKYFPMKAKAEEGSD